MKLLTSIASLVGSIAFLGVFWVATSHPDGHFDQVKAKFSPGLDHLFWMNQEADEFSLFDLEKEKRSPPCQFDLSHPEWAPDGSSILTLRHDHALNRTRFATIDPENLEISMAGEPASCFVQASDAKLLFLGRGDYMEDTGHFDIHGFASHRLEGTSSTDGGYSMVKLSPSGELLAVSMWGYNDPDRFEILRMNDWSKVIDARHEASFVFFLPDGRHLIAIESTAARIALHHYDLETGELLKTARESSGWCESAALSPDGKTLAIGTLNYDSEPQIEMFSTATLALLQTRSIDGGREVLDLAFEPAGDSLLAITRSGEVWRWSPSDRELVEVARIIPERGDSRWIPVSFGLGLYMAFWVLLLMMRRRLSNDDSSPRTFVPGKSWLLGVIVFEVFYLLLNFSSLISYGGIFLASAHLVLAGAAVIFLISSAILRLRTNYSVGIGFTAILVVGALFGFTVVKAALSSV